MAAKKGTLEEISCKEETCIQKTNIALTQQSIMNIENSLEKICGKLDGFIDTAHKTFATKEEHRENKIEIEKMKEDILESKLTMAKWIGAGIVIAQVIAFILNKYV